MQRTTSGVRFLSSKRAQRSYEASVRRRRRRRRRRSTRDDRLREREESQQRMQLGPATSLDEPVIKAENEEDYDSDDFFEVLTPSLRLRSLRPKILSRGGCVEQLSAREHYIRRASSVNILSSGCRDAATLWETESCLYESFRYYNNLECHVLSQDRSVYQFC